MGKPAPSFNLSDEKSYALQYLTLTAVSVIILLAGLFPRNFGLYFQIVSIPFHSTIEAVGALAGLIMGIFLIQRGEGNENKLFMPAIGFIGMGVLDGFHAATLPGHGFVLFKSMANLAGGFLFAMIWIQDYGRYSVLKRWLPWVVTVLSVLFGVFVLFFREALPVMVHKGEFTAFAKNINLLSGVLFIAAAGRLLIDFQHSRSLETYLFSCLTLLFGLSCLMFKSSILWDGVWWYWHFLRLAAYILVLGSIVSSHLQMISDLRITTEAMKASEKKYKDLVDNAIAGIYQSNLKGEILYVNNALAKIYGFESPDEMISSGALARYKNPKDREAMLERLKKTGRIADYELELLAKRGETKNVLISATLDRDAFSGVVVDITGRRRAESELRVNLRKAEIAESKFRGILESAPDPIVIVKREGLIMLVNTQTEKVFGYSRDELIGKSVEALVPDRLRVAHARHREGYCSKPSPRAMGACLDIVCLRKDGGEFPADISLSPIETDEGLLVISIIRDITDRRQAEERIKASLKEKEVLLREVYHRVKNNMQVISSMLSLQSEYIKDERAVEMCKESQDRIRSMALVHEKLYKSGNLAIIDYDDYIKDLVNSLLSFYEDKARKIYVNTKVEDVSLSVDAAIPCGLIINELVSNSIKHAFPENIRLGDRRCEISITLRPIGQDLIELVVGDNGIGMPADIDLNKVETLGLRLVSILAKQLQGSIELERKEGAEFRVRFKDMKYK